MLDKTLTIISVTEEIFEESILKEIYKLQIENKAISNRITKQFKSNYITPFDREDIHFIVNTLNKISSQLYYFNTKINTFQEKQILNFIKLIVKKLQQVYIVLNQIVCSLKNKKKYSMIVELLPQFVSQVNESMNEFTAFKADLYNGNKGNKDFLKLLEITNSTETLLSNFKNVSTCFESILIKYS
jgi:uncharacterized protein Yka (UPF0111/DUF47 family)